jgi:hypothetical protein
MKLLKQVGPCMASHGITGGGHNEIGGGGGGGGKGGGKWWKTLGATPKEGCGSIGTAGRKGKDVIEMS